MRRLGAVQRNGSAQINTMKRGRFCLQSGGDDGGLVHLLADSSNSSSPHSPSNDKPATETGQNPLKCHGSEERCHGIARTIQEFHSLDALHPHDRRLNCLYRNVESLKRPERETNGKSSLLLQDHRSTCLG